jgi:hypothetical protein
MFILTPHIVEVNQETLARFQATRLRDVTEAEQMQDDAEISDDEREKRDLERKDNRERRKEKQEDYLSRRKAEIEHGKEMRQFDRKREKIRLENDIDDWKKQAQEERAKFEAEEKQEEESRKKSKEP